MTMGQKKDAMAPRTTAQMYAWVASPTMPVRAIALDEELEQQERDDRPDADPEEPLKHP